MILNFSVKANTNEDKILLFKNGDFTQFENNVIPLFGPNGVGKSTLINGLINQSLNIKSSKPGICYSYQNSKDNFKTRQARNLPESFDPFFLNMKFNSQYISEGQSIIYSMFDLLDAFKKNGAFEYHKDKDSIVLLDEIDSGMSIDNIDTTMRKIKYISRIRDDIQIIMSFNSPRVLKWFPEVFSMYDGNKLTLHTDEDMLKEIRKHKKEFDKLRKDSYGRPKIVY